MKPIRDVPSRLVYNHEYAVGQVVGTLVVEPHLRQAIKYISPHYTIKATRHGKHDKRDHQSVFVVTIGRPNWREQKFIKLVKKAKVAFPVWNILVR